MADDPEDDPEREDLDDEEEMSDDEWDELQRRKPRQAVPIGHAQSRGRFVVAGCFLAAAVAAIYFLEIPFPFDFNDPSDSYIIPIVLTAIALVLGIAALRTAMVGRKYGTPVLDYAPPLLGSHFAAEVTLDKPVPATGDYQLSLTCWAKTVDDSSADDGAKSYGKRWRHKWTVPHGQVAATGKVPIAVQLPPVSLGIGSVSSVSYWALVIKAQTPGTDFDVEFQPQIYVP